MVIITDANNNILICCQTKGCLRPQYVLEIADTGGAFVGGLHVYMTRQSRGRVMIISAAEQ